DTAAFFGVSNLKGVYFSGDAPSLRSAVFLAANNVTVYYLPGTAGWTSTFGGRPTALWQPEVLAGGPGFGVQTNGFGFAITWASGRVIVVEASTNLVNPVWTAVETNTLGSSSSYFSDPNWTNHLAAFYRIRSP